jgi:hypothetical protein
VGLVRDRHVVVDDDVDALNVDAAAHQVRRHQDADLRGEGGGGVCVEGWSGRVE